MDLKQKDNQVILQGFGLKRAHDPFMQIVYNVTPNFFRIVKKNRAMYLIGAVYLNIS